MVDQERTALPAEDGGGSTDEMGGNGWQRKGQQSKRQVLALVQVEGLATGMRLGDAGSSVDLSFWGRWLYEMVTQYGYGLP